MQIKFITLTISAILALSAMSANAAPAAIQDATTPAATAGESKSVQGQSPADIVPMNKAALGDATGLLGVVGGLINNVVEPLLKDVLVTVYKLLDALLGSGGASNRQGIVNELLQNVLQLISLKDGELTGHRPTGAPGAPKSDSPIDLILCFLQNLLNGHGSNAAAGNDIPGLLAAVQSLLGGSPGSPGPQQHQGGPSGHQ